MTLVTPGCASCVSVHLCCCYKIPETGEFIKNRNLFLEVLGKSKIKVLAGSVSVSKMEPYCCVLQREGHCVLMWEKVEG